MTRLTQAVSALLTLIAATVCLAAQTRVTQQTSPEVFVLEFSSHKNFRRPDWDRGTTYRMTRGILSPQRQEVLRQYVYEVTIQNRSAKTITAVEWDYVFIDPATQAEVARHRFQSREQIRPGRKRSLTGRSNTPETRVIPAEAVARDGQHPFTERVIIGSVSYAEDVPKSADNH
jgi:hypothetical protein